MNSRSEPHSTLEERDRRRPGRSWWRRVGSIALIVLAGVFVVVNRRELPAAWHTVRRADPVWLAVAAGLTIGGVWNTAGSYGSAMAAAGVPIGRRTSLRTSTVAHGLNLVVKSGGMAGLPVFLADARRAGRSAAAVVAGYLLVALAGELSFAMVLGAAIGLLVVDRHLGTADVVATAVFVVYLGVRVGAVALAVRNPDRVTRLTGKVRELVGRLRHEAPRTADDPPPERGVHELRMALGAVGERPLSGLAVMAHSLLTEVVGITTLYCVLRALGVDLGWSVPFVAYSVSVLFGIVAFVPAGLGVVELSTGAALVEAHVPVATATAAVVLFRSFEVWAPVALGLLVHQFSARTRRPGPASRRLDLASGRHG